MLPRLAIFVATIFFAAFLAFFVSGSGYVDVQGEILRAIENISVYDLSESRLEEIRTCMLKRPFIELKIPKDTKLERDFVIHSCFKEDGYARYLSPVGLNWEEEIKSGRYSGIGIVIEENKAGTGAVIRSIKPDMPASLSGKFEVGDIIISVGENKSEMKSLDGLSLDEISNLIRGPINKEVVLEITREGKKLPLITVVREEIKVRDAASREVASGIGYLKIESFIKFRLIVDDIDPILEDFDNSGVKALIIDLRGNPGGLLYVALWFLERFSPETGLIMVTERDRGIEDYPFLTRRVGKYADWKLAVLIDANSASASELVAGVLRLWNNTKIIGTKSYGKGSVQSRISLSDGGAYYLTTALYYFANGETPDGKGIVPDMAVKDTESSNQDRDMVLEEAVNYLKGALEP